MMIELKIIRRISKAEGKFSAYGPGERKLMCYLHDKDDWDKIIPDTSIVVKGSLMAGDNFMVLAIIDANGVAEAEARMKAEARAAKSAMYKNWAIKRILGLRDIPTVLKIFVSRCRANRARKTSNIESPKHLGEIQVGHDTQVDYWVEPMAAGTQSCPYWDTTRLFYGREMNFSIDEKPMEYFLGIRETCLAPIIPIPICSYEEVHILGTTPDPFYKCMNKYGKARSFHDHAGEFGSVKIFDEMTTWFIENDKYYRDDPVYSTCG